MFTQQNKTSIGSYLVNVTRVGKKIEIHLPSGPVYFSFHFHLSTWDFERHSFAKQCAKSEVLKATNKVTNHAKTQNVKLINIWQFYTDLSPYLYTLM